MKRYALFAAVLAALVWVTLATGCGPLSTADKPPEPVHLDGTSWILIRMLEREPLSNTKATLTFKDDQISGLASCNRYFGGVTIKGDTITAGMVGSTEMWCGEPEGVMNQETDYLKALSAIARYSVENDELTLFSTDGQSLLVFAPGTE